MQIKLVFENSGDELTFTAINHEVAEYYIDKLNQYNNNNFAVQDSIDQQISRNISSLRQSIIDANSFIHLLTGNKLDVSYSDDDFLDQKLLNQLHANWVNSHYSQYNVQQNTHSEDPAVRELAEKLHTMLPDEISIIGTALSKLDLLGKYDRMNMAIHALEESFNYIKFKTSIWYSVPNPFPKSVLTNDVCNLRIAFNHLGRTLYNKYINFDNSLGYNDENTYDELLGFVGVYLSRPQTIQLSTEYIAWCRERNIEPTGNFLNIGNLPDIDTRLTEYRQLIYRNTKSNNRITLIKG